MRVTRLINSEELDVLADSWNCLTRAVPFRSWQWLATWWKHYGAGRDLYVLAVHNDDSVLVGIAPLFRERQTASGLVLNWLGSGEVCTDYMTVLASHEYEEAVSAALATWLIEHSDHSEHAWDLMQLDGVAANDRCLAAFIETLSTAGCKAYRHSDISSWRLPLSSSWEAFLASVSKNRRKNIRRLYREATENPRVQVHRARNEVEFETGLRVLTDLHQRRLISQGEPGCFASAAFSSFLRESAERLLRSDMLDLWWLEFEGRPIAAEIDLVDGDTVYGYQGGVDPEALEHSPGNLLTTVILQHAIANGRTTYDFLRGDELYKQQWKASRIQLLRCRVAANRTVPQLRHGAWAAGNAVKSWVKGGLTLAGLH